MYARKRDKMDFFENVKTALSLSAMVGQRVIFLGSQNEIRTRNRSQDRQDARSPHSSSSDENQWGCLGSLEPKGENHADL